ncbi:MAG: hypothetical protein ACRCVT_05860 [Leadbetterella sp.]
MKKTILFASLLGIIVSFPGCNGGSEPVAVSCDSQVEKVTAALFTYSSSSTKSNCNAYVNSLKDFVNSACFKTYGTAVDRKEFQDAINEVDCNDL